MKDMFDLLLAFVTLVSSVSAAAAGGYALGFARGKLDEIERPRREYEAMMAREDRRNHKPMVANGVVGMSEAEWDAARGT